MITVQGKRYIQGTDKWDFDFKCDSNDTKPTVSFNGEKIADNSLLLECDTKKWYYYTNEDWAEMGA